MRAIFSGFLVACALLICAPMAQARDEDETAMGVLRMRALCEVEFTAQDELFEKLSEDKNSPAELEIVKEAVKAKEPVMILFTSYAQDKRGGDEKETQETTRVKSAIFGGGDWKIGLASKCFRRYSIDLTKASKKDNKTFYSSKAPILYVFDNQGKLVDTLNAKKITGKKLFKSMEKALGKSGFKTKVLDKTGIALLMIVRDKLNEAERKTDIAETFQENLTRLRARDDAKEKIIERKEKELEDMQKEIAKLKRSAEIAEEKIAKLCDVNQKEEIDIKEKVEKEEKDDEKDKKKDKKKKKDKEDDEEEDKEAE